MFEYRFEYSLVTIHKIVTGKIDCQDLLAHSATRFSRPFYFPTPKTNLLEISPLYIMDLNYRQM